ncbi:MAG: T9SS type A sorting domain-containing protein [Bacteroidetes bacterium]|nr:T9SS type A sorting domain-containing protein [Bacteroidota bacterium]
MQRKVFTLVSFFLANVILAFAQLNMVKDIYTGSTGSSTSAIIEFNSKLMLVSNTDSTGTSLLAYDPINGMQLVLSGNSVTFGSFNMERIQVYNNKLYFVCDDGVNGRELWSYDGVNAPAIAADINPGATSSNPQYLTVYNNKLYFYANGSQGPELHSFDGTTVSVIEIVPGSNGPTPIDLCVFNNKLYFAADSSVFSQKWALWVYDGSTTSIAANINTGGVSGIQKLKSIGNYLYFQGYNTTTNNQVWRFDGNNASMISTNIVSFPFTGPAFTEYNGKIYFTASEGVNGFELWEYDGLVSPVLKHDFNFGSANGSPYSFTNFSNKLFFGANNGSIGSELWSFDGNAPSLVEDIRAGSSSSSPFLFTPFNGKLYFTANDGINGNELWSYKPCVHTSAIIAPTVCISYTSPSGKTITTSTTFNDTIANSIGCDSIITINLTIKNPTTHSLTIANCYSYTSPSGKVVTSSSTFNDTIANTAGCDSIIAINLTIKSSSTFSLNASACGSYTSPSGKTITTSSNFNDTITNSLGCDSIIAISLIINTVDTGVTVVGNTITANLAGASYQWLDCNNNFSPISLATNGTFQATVSGSYAVEITTSSCTDTSACSSIVINGITDYTKSNVSVWPNPGSGLFTITLEKTASSTQIEVFNFSGKLVLLKTIKNTNQTTLELEGASGLYFIKTTSDNTPPSWVRVIKE